MASFMATSESDPQLSLMMSRGMMQVPSISYALISMLLAKQIPALIPELLHSFHLAYNSLTFVAISWMKLEAA